MGAASNDGSGGNPAPAFASMSRLIQAYAQDRGFAEAMGRIQRVYADKFMDGSFARYLASMDDGSEPAAAVPAGFDKAKLAAFRDKLLEGGRVSDEIVEALDKSLARNAARFNDTH